MMAEPKDEPERLPFRITGEQLRQWRKAVGISQRELAKRIYWSDTQIADWERGKKAIPHDIDLYQRVVEALQVAGDEKVTRLVDAAARERLSETARELVALGQALW